MFNHPLQPKLICNIKASRHFVWSNSVQSSSSAKTKLQYQGIPPFRLVELRSITLVSQNLFAISRVFTVSFGRSLLTPHAHNKTPVRCSGPGSLLNKHYALWPINGTLRSPSWRPRGLHHAAHAAHSAAAHWWHWRQVFLDVCYACFCSEEHC